MEDIPLGFILILFGFFVAAIVLTAIVIVWKQRRLQRLKDPHKDYYRKKGIAGFSDLFKYARMQSGRFFTFLVRKSDCFCKFARLYADETNIRHIDFRPAPAVLRLLGGGGHPSRTAPEDRLVS